MGAKKDAALEARVAALEAVVAGLCVVTTREHTPVAWPEPLDVHALNATAANDYAGWIEPDIWGSTVYI